MMSVERAMAKAAASLLPGLLPTPPTKPSLIILPASFNSKTKPGRADSAERWDAHKKDKKPTKTPASSCSSSSSPGRASSCGERWDINKRISGSSRTSSSSSSSSRRSSTSPGASSAGRWDAHKKEKPRPAQASAESRTSDKEDQEEETMAMVPNLAAPPRIDPMFSGPSFPVASPDPSMLPVPVPAFFRPRDPGVLPVQAAFLGVH